jgi:hypothetical protein
MSWRQRLRRRLLLTNAAAAINYTNSNACAGTTGDGSTSSCAFLLAKCFLLLRIVLYVLHNDTI